VTPRQNPKRQYDPEYTASKVDSYANLILLCEAHHKLIDDNEDVFSGPQLEDLKRRHEERVAKALANTDHSPWVEGPDWPGSSTAPTSLHL
jgi:hypothetical protein